MWPKKNKLFPCFMWIKGMFGWGGIGWMENNGEKIGEKMSLCVVWLKRGERKFLGRAQTFSTRTHTKLVSLK